MSKKDSKKAEKPPADAGKDVESKGKGVVVELPYKEDTDKYKVAKALIAGETDRKKMQRELNVRANTIYNVTADLSNLGYTLAIHQNKKILLTPPSSASPSLPLTPSTSHKIHPATIPSFTPEQTAGILKLLGGEKEEKESEKTSPEISPAATPAQNPPQDLVKLLAVEVVKVLGGKAPEGQQLHGQPVPFEDVEIVGEKVNYKVALNPEIFYRYSVFNALLNLRLAR